MSHEEARYSRNYTVINPKLIQAVILSADERQADSCAAELTEIAKTGAKLLVTGLPVLHSQCRVSLASARLEGPLVLSADLHAARPNLAGDWLVECSFRPPLANAAFAKFVHSGLLACRATPREPVRIAVEVEWTSSAKRQAGIVRDLSVGGLCLAIPQAPPELTEACVVARDRRGEVRIPVKIRWSRPVGEDYFVGCQFFDESSHALLRKFQPTARSHFQSAPRVEEIKTL